MKHIKTYRLFESNVTSELTEEQIDFLNMGFRGNPWSMEDGFINSGYSFDVSGNNLKDFMGLKFGKVSYFNCSKNLLESLEGSPRKVSHSFDCSYNKLETLEGSPDFIGGNFDCSNNNLLTLQGGPSQVFENYDCSHNLLENLEGLPQSGEIGSLYFNNNNVVSLRGLKVNVVTSGFNGQKNPISESAIHYILPEMRKGKSYKEALLDIWTFRLGEEDKSLLYPDIKEDLSNEEVKRLEMMARYNKSRHMF